MAAHLPELSDRDVQALDAWWRANNYLTVGQIYLLANPLLREPLSADHIKPRLLGLNNIWRKCLAEYLNHQVPHINPVHHVQNRRVVKVHFGTERNVAHEVRYLRSNVGEVPRQFQFLRDGICVIPDHLLRSLWSTKRICTLKQFFQCQNIHTLIAEGLFFRRTLFSR